MRINEIEKMFTAKFMDNVFFDAFIESIYFLKITKIRPNKSKQLAETIKTFTLKNFPDIPKEYFEEKKAWEYMNAVSAFPPPDENKKGTIFFKLAGLDLILFLLSQTNLAQNKGITHEIIQLRQTLGNYIEENLKYITHEEYDYTFNNLTLLASLFDCPEIILFENHEIKIV